MEWYLRAFSKYAVFNGRSGRKEFWFFLLFFTIGLLLFAIADKMLGTIVNGHGVLSTLFLLLNLLPNLGVTIRRLHDTDRSGWWILVNVIPFIGWVILLVLCALKGDEGGNSYGMAEEEPSQSVNPE